MSHERGCVVVLALMYASSSSSASSCSASTSSASCARAALGTKDVLAVSYCAPCFLWMRLTHRPSLRDIPEDLDQQIGKLGIDHLVPAFLPFIALEKQTALPRYIQQSLVAQHRLTYDSFLGSREQDRDGASGSDSNTDMREEEVLNDCFPGRRLCRRR